MFILESQRKQVIISSFRVVLLIFNAKHVLQWYDYLHFWNKLSCLQVV